MPIKVVGFHLTPFVRRVLFALVEFGVEEFEILPLNSGKGEQKVPEHLAHQPFGKLPYIDDDGFILFESRAILTYLAEKYAPEYAGKDLKEKALIRQWVDAEGFEYMEGAKPFIFQQIFKPFLGMGDPDPAIVDEARKKIEAYFDILDKHLESQEFLAGNRFTIAEITHIPFTEMFGPAKALDLIESRPNVKAWWDKISTKETYVKFQDKYPFA